MSFRLSMAHVVAPSRVTRMPRLQHVDMGRAVAGFAATRPVWRQPATPSRAALALVPIGVVVAVLAPARSAAARR
jgi:hypothetical protein